MRTPILCSLLLVCATSAIGQEFRFSGGYNGSNVREAGDEHWVGRGGYQFGVDALLGSRIFVKPGIHFLVRNLRYSYSSGTDVAEQDFTYTSRSIGVPVMLGVHLMDPADAPTANFYVMGGPTALIGVNADLDNDALRVDTKGTQWYIGAAAGVSVSFVFLEAGYNAAMTNVFKGNEFQTNPKVNYMYGVVGVRLALAK